MRQATKDHKFHACIKFYNFVSRKTPKLKDYCRESGSNP